MPPSANLHIICFLGCYVQWHPLMQNNLFKCLSAGYAKTRFGLQAQGLVRNWADPLSEKNCRISNLPVQSLLIYQRSHKLSDIYTSQRLVFTRALWLSYISITYPKVAQPRQNIFLGKTSIWNFVQTESGAFSTPTHNNKQTAGLQLSPDSSLILTLVGVKIEFDWLLMFTICQQANSR